jgi:type I site-specific restriction endonuclease
MPTPEAVARENIDRQLTAAGWVVQSIPDLNLYAGRGVALREFRLDSGSVDYLLLVDRKAVGVIEANKEGTTLTDVEAQAAHFGRGLQSVPAPVNPLPFQYASTGIDSPTFSAPIRGAEVSIARRITRGFREHPVARRSSLRSSTSFERRWTSSSRWPMASPTSLPASSLRTTHHR